MIEIKTVEEFENIKNNGKVSVIKFGAEWCRPCGTMHSILESLSKKFDNVVFAEVDVEEATDLAEMFAIRNIPVTIIFKDGELVDMSVGLQSETDMEKKINSFV